MKLHTDGCPHCSGVPAYSVRNTSSTAIPWMAQYYSCFPQISLNYTSRAASPGSTSAVTLPSRPSLGPSAIVSSLDGLVQAVTDSSVTSITMTGHIQLNGTELAGTQSAVHYPGRTSLADTFADIIWGFRFSARRPILVRHGELLLRSALHRWWCLSVCAGRRTLRPRRPRPVPRFFCSRWLQSHAHQPGSDQRRGPHGRPCHRQQCLHARR